VGASSEASSVILGARLDLRSGVPSVSLALEAELILVLFVGVASETSLPTDSRIDGVELRVLVDLDGVPTEDGEPALVAVRLPLEGVSIWASSTALLDGDFQKIIFRLKVQRGE